MEWNPNNSNGRIMQKIKVAMMIAIAASLGGRGIAATSQRIGSGLQGTAKQASHIDWDVAQASCEGDVIASSDACDLSVPMQFGGCGSACCDSSANCDSFTIGNKSLFGLGMIKQSEGCYDDFISPMTNPVYFEDPRQLTEVRGIFIHHNIPSLLGLPSDELRLYALQVRLRLTENLSLIAVKDGYIDSSSPLITSGWADVGAGLKYSLYRDPELGQLLSVGARFETTAGTRSSLQANGDGVFDFFLSGGTRLGSSAHYLSTTGFILPVDSQAENQMFYWSHHLDRRFGSMFYGFTELNWYNFMKSGTGLAAPIEGGDLFNLGSRDIAGNNMVTNAWGVKLKPNRNIESGVAFEFPLTERRGILENRLTADLILRF